MKITATFKHITSAIGEIRAMRGPAEGDLLVDLRSSHDWWGYFPPEGAIQVIRDNPRIEFKATEKWRLTETNPASES